MFWQNNNIYKKENYYETTFFVAITINIISFIAKNCNLHLAKEACLIINKHVIMDYYAKIGYLYNNTWNNMKTKKQKGA